MGAEPCRRSLKIPAEKLGSVIVEVITVCDIFNASISRILSFSRDTLTTEKATQRFDPVVYFTEIDKELLNMHRVRNVSTTCENRENVVNGDKTHVGYSKHKRKTYPGDIGDNAQLSQ